jgi:predicted nucleic acid-binding protein
VLDTNVVLDLLLFDDPLARPLRQALENGDLRCVATEATLDELQRVLAYPGFALGPVQQAALFARYQAWSERVEAAGAGDGLPHKGMPIHHELKPVWRRMPRCSDPDDQKFIELAAAAGAQGLISKDRAVLKLRRQCAPHFKVMTPAEAVRWLSEPTH